MIVGVDIGGSKTLVATFELDDTPPRLLDSSRLPTRKDFAAQYTEVVRSIRELTSNQPPQAIVIGSRGELQRDDTLTDKKILGWIRVPLVAQLKRDFGCPVELFNDAALATLAEARFGAGKGFERVFYCTISSGIGTGFAVRGELVLDRSGGGDIVISENRLDADSQTHTLEQLVSGSAIKQHFGHTGDEITDPAVWQQIASELALVLNEFIVLTQPEVVIMGGGIGQHFHLYEAPLRQALENYTTSQYPLPTLVQADFVEDGVIRGASLKGQELVRHD